MSSLHTSSRSDQPTSRITSVDWQVEENLGNRDPLDEPTPSDPPIPGQTAPISGPSDYLPNPSNANNQISITFERVRPGADPNFPLFLQHLGKIAERSQYTNVVLPYVASCTFEIASALDINFMVAMLKSNNLPGMHTAVTKLTFPNFYWFSGVNNNRKSCPSLAFAASLPAVRELSITFHTAGLTTSAFTERERIRLETADLEKSKLLRVLRLDDIIKRYDLARIFDCPSITNLHLECINSEMVAFFSRAADPLGPFRDLAHWIQRGYFDMHGRRITVISSVTDSHQ